MRRVILKLFDGNIPECEETTLVETNLSNEELNEKVDDVAENDKTLQDEKGDAVWSYDELIDRLEDLGYVKTIKCNLLEIRR